MSRKSNIIKTAHFDFELGKRIWKPMQFSHPSFTLGDPQKLVRTLIEVWGDSNPITGEWPWTCWGVNVDFGLIRPDDRGLGKIDSEHHLGHFSFLRIENVEYNEEMGYVQFNFNETENSSTGPHPRALRIFDSGYVCFGGGMWEHSQRRTHANSFILL